MDSQSGQLIVDHPNQQLSTPLKIGVIAEKRYLSHAQPAGMMAALVVRGHEVVLLDPENSCYQPGRKNNLSKLDVVIARGRSWGVLCLLDWMEREGLPVVNRRASIAAVHNKAEMAVALASAAIPTPCTLLGSISHIAAAVPAERYPLILKPIFGDNGRGLRVVNSRRELLSLAWPEPFVLAQQFITGSNFDLKLYCIGRSVWAVRKPCAWSPQEPPDGQSSVATLLPVTPAFRELAWRCGALFGLEVFGVDCIETPAGPVVIEVNEFPNYSAVPEAGQKLADYVLARVHQEAAA